MPRNNLDALISELGRVDGLKDTPDDMSIPGRDARTPEGDQKYFQAMSSDMDIPTTESEATRPPMPPGGEPVAVEKTTVAVAPDEGEDIDEDLASLDEPGKVARRIKLLNQVVSEVKNPESRKLMARRIQGISEQLGAFRDPKNKKSTDIKPVVRELLEVQGQLERLMSKQKDVGPDRGTID